MRVLIIFIFFFSFSYVQAQQDTIYVLYENIEPNYVLELRKHKDDSVSKDFFPFDGGRHYNMSKKVGNFKERLTFSFNSYTPEWMDFQFYYQEVDKSILEEKDFKDRAWLDKTEYVDIIRFFGNNKEHVIMLLDETHLNDEQVYLVRVYFGFNAEE